MEDRNQSRGVVIAIVIVIAIIVVLGLVFGWFGGGQSFEQVDDNVTENDMNQELPEGLEISEDVPGTGEAIAGQGDLVRVHYRGMFENGEVFDSSFERGEPLPFVIGAGQVIEGMERGVIGMREGGTRTLTIAPELAYGAEGFGQIPGNATLVFEIELVSVEEPTGDKL